MFGFFSCSFAFTFFFIAQHARLTPRLLPARKAFFWGKAPQKKDQERRALEPAALRAKTKSKDQEQTPILIDFRPILCYNIAGVFLINSIYHDHTQLKLLEMMHQRRPVMAGVFLLGISTGLRISDILAIRTSDFSKEFSVIQQKTKKAAHFILSNSTYSYIRRYINGREDSSPYLFPVSRHTVWRNFTKFGTTIDLELRPHDMRRIFAFNILRTFSCVKTVQQHMDHKYMSVTVLYLIPAILWLAGLHGHEKPILKPAKKIFAEKL